MKVHLPLAEDMLDKLVRAEFDMAYSQDALLGHSFAAVYEWIIADRGIPVVPIFINTYLPPLPSPRRCHALGKAIADIIKGRPERVVIVASGGMSHYPGTWKYPQPAYDFDYWAIAQMERGNLDPILSSDLRAARRGRQHGDAAVVYHVRRHRQRSRRADHVSAHLASRARRHAVPAEQAQGSAHRRQSRLPTISRRADSNSTSIPQPSSYALNKVLYELRLSSELRKRFFKDTQAVAKEYGLNPKESAALETIKDENIDSLRSLKPHPLVDAGAHALGMLMCLVVVQAEQRRLRAAGEL